MMQDIEIAGVVDEVAAANSVNAAAILLVGDYGVCLWYDPGNGINRVDLMYDDVPKLNTIFEQVWG